MEMKKVNRMILLRFLDKAVKLPGLKLKKLADTSSTVQVDDYRLENQDANLKSKV